MNVLAEGSSAIVILFSSCLTAGVCQAQDVAPRVYIITPIHSNAITLTYPSPDGGPYLRGNDTNHGGYPAASVALGHEEKARVLPLRN